MARNGGNNVSSRRIIAGVFVFVGLFATCFGVGNRSQALIVVGAAIVVLSFSVRLFSSWRRSPRQWVLGTGVVVEVADPPPDARVGRCSLQLTVNAPGVPNDTVLVNDPRVPVAQWPYPGLELPIEVASDDPRNIRIRWKQVPAREPAYAGQGQQGPGYEGPEYEGPEYDGPGFDTPGYGDDPYLDDGPHPDEPAPARTAPPPRPRTPVIDFDLDGPPVASGPGGGQSATATLPPELGEFDEFGNLQQSRTADGRAEPVSVLEHAPEVPRPRRRPRPHGAAMPDPEASPDPAASPDPEGGLVEDVSPDADASPDAGPDAFAEPDLAPASSPEPDPAATGAREPEPALAGAAAAAAPAAAATAAAGGSRVEELVTAYPSAYPGPSGAINYVGITVLVSDLDRSVEFYRDQLGFYEVDGGEGNTVLASGETRLVLRSVPGLKRTTQRSVYLNLEVSDLDAVYTELRASGVGFTAAPRRVNSTNRLELWAATFRDPDGHGIALTEWRSAPARTAGTT